MYKKNKNIISWYYIMLYLISDVVVAVHAHLEAAIWIK